MANLLTIYVGPYAKFKKVAGLDPSDLGVRLAVPCVLPDEDEYDIWIPYNQIHMVLESNHRDIGYDYTEIKDTDALIAKWKRDGDRTLAYLQDAYGAEPSFHFGIVTGPG